MALDGDQVAAEQFAQPLLGAQALHQLVLAADLAVRFWRIRSLQADTLTENGDRVAVDDADIAAMDRRGGRAGRRREDRRTKQERRRDGSKSCHKILFP